MGKKISELPETTTLTTGSDVMLVVSTNDTKKVKISNILKYGNQYTGTDIKSLTSNWDNVYSNVQTNSASWIIDNSTDTGVRSLTSNWQNTSTKVQITSSSWDNVYTNVQTNSASWAIDSSIDTEVRSLTSNWEDTYTNVQTNSASWAIDSSIDTEVRSLTSNWEDAYTNVQTNSASYVTFTEVQNNYLPLSGGEMSGDLSATNVFLTSGIVQTFSNSVTASGDFLILNINGTNRALRLWDF